MSTKSRSIEDTYPLSPMQEGLLFHSLYAPQSGVYVTQVTCTVRNLNVPALERAWKQASDRQPILRTAFVWKNLEKPLQVVGRQVGLPLEQQDWRGLPAAEQEERFQSYLADERSRGFELSKAPLMRVAAFQVADDVYRLVWSHHHILLDGWSLRLLLKEVFTIYDGLCRDQEIRLAPARPFRDYIAWLQKQDIGAAEAFWRRQLAGFSTPTSLASLASLGAARINGSANGRESSHEEQRIKLTVAASDALQQLARRHQLTLNTLVQGALALVMSHYAGVEDVIFGSVVSGRPPELADVESMVGLFVNTLPTRAQIPTRSPLLAWLKEFQEQEVETRRFEYSPLVKVQAWSDAPRGLPLFDTLYAFENYPANPFSEQRPASLEVSDFRVIEKDNYPLTVFSRPGSPLHLKVLYDSHIYDAGNISRMLGHLRTLLEGFAANPERNAYEIPLLTDAERNKVLVEWNDTALDYPKERCMHELFEAQAEQTPEATALVCGNQRLSYRELNHRANQLARYLRKLGAGPEVLVGICLDRSVEMVVALLATLKAGGAYVPLDPAYPQERLNFILEDTQAPVLLTRERLAAGLRIADCGLRIADGSERFATRNPQSAIRNPQSQMVCLDADWEAIAGEAEENPASGVTAGDLAYVIYTSGSTGKPKGVAIEHRNAGALIHWAKGVFSQEELAGVLASTSICFDLSVFELFVTLSCGGKVILAENALQLPILPAASEVTLINTVPSAMAELVRMNGAPASVVTVNLAGEPLQTRLVNEIYRQETIRRVFDLYGPSEDTTYSTFALRSAEGPATIGRPIANSQVYLLDRHLHPVPAGLIGELYIGGDGLARGYLNRPDLTAERWIPNPFSGTAGERLYATGDLARYLSDGNIEFLGRKDHQVKIHGFRIELGEIETALGKHPAIQDAVVLAREDSPGEKRLVAYVTPKPEAAFTTAELREFVEQKLPHYMTPSAFVMLDTLPLTPNGKVDRKRLPAPDVVGLERAGDLIAPRGPIEESLAPMWADVLGLDQVGVDDNFFDLGGHSLRATQIISRVREAFQVELPLRAFFESPTVAELARRIEAARQTENDLQAPPIQPVSRDEDLPLSYAQQRLWFLDQLSQGRGFYNIPAAIRLSGRLNVAAMEASLNEIAQRHEALRTTFSNVSGRPVQVIAPAAPFNLQLMDLTNLSQPERETKLRQLITEEARRPFDLARGPLFRVTLARLEDEENALVCAMHHIISDGWSIGVLIKEFAALYQAFIRGEKPALPALPVQYADFAHWQRQWMQGEALERELSYWREQLSGSLAVLELPTDRPRPAAQTYRGAALPIRIPAELSARLKDLSRREGVTLFMTLLAAFQTLLHRYSGQDDILVGSPIAGRTRAEVEGLIGFFVNTLVLRGDFSDDPTFREMLRRVRQTTLDAYSHQELPFDQLVEALQPQRALSHAPLFQVMFVLQNTPRQALQAPGLSLSAMPVEAKTAKFDLTLALTDTEQGLSGSLEYNTDLFEAATINRIAGHFQTLLESVTANPKARVSALPLMTEPETKRLLVEWNQTAREFPGEQTLPALFEAQVERTPEAVAVIFEDAQLSYRELNKQANRLAHHLRRLGVVPESLVGICMDRSLEMLVGILGVLKAGGAYVPMDPAYPLERLIYMLEDSGAAVLLTQQQLVEAVSAIHNPRCQVICLNAIENDDGVEESPRSDEFIRHVTNKFVTTWSEENLDSSVTAETAAYVIYTSGSTGQPKGVVIPHSAICNHMLWLRDHFSMSAADRVLQKTPISFDASVWEFFAPLFVGGQLILARQGGHQDAAYLVRTIAEQRVTILQLVPSLLRMLLDEPGFERLQSLRRVVSGGEALPAELQERFHASLNAELHNFYGPTETAIDVTCWPYGHADGRRIVPLGYPIANTQIYLLSPAWQPSPIGAPGELCIGGANLSRGYLNRPELTAEKFIPNPFSSEPGARLYRTGDLARYLPDGAIEYLGRADHQVKIRGFRIELGEIESALRQHPSLREAAVLARDDRTGAKRLVAYVTSGEEPAPTVSELRTFLKGTLPEHMTPSAFVFLEAMPLAPNGKVNRRVLPEPDHARPELDAAFVAPRTLTEEMLTELWSQLLGVERVGIYDNFFELGGHSLLATQLVSRVRETFGVELSLIKLFESPVIAELAAMISESQANGQEQNDSRIERAQRGDKNLEELIAELESLSDDEVQALMAEEYKAAAAAQGGGQ
ncbi:MAG: amino acid adenylation domain-containing protein [Blastocatellales bacterium]